MKIQTLPANYGAPRRIQAKQTPPPPQGPQDQGPPPPQKHSARLAAAIGATAGSLALGCATAQLTGSAAHAAGMVQGAIALGAAGAIGLGAAGAMLGSLAGDNPNSKGLGMFVGGAAGGSLGAVSGLVYGAIHGASTGVSSGNLMGFAAGAVLGASAGLYFSKHSR